MWINRKPYKNKPIGGIPGAMQNFARKFPDGKFEVSKGGFWYYTINGFRVMAKKFKSPLFGGGYHSRSGYHSTQGTWKFICFNAKTGETLESNLLFEEAIDFVKGN